MHRVPAAKSDERLGARATRGVLWSAYSMLATQGLQTLSKVLLARMLSPDAFGLVGMALVFTALVQVINDLGLGAAIVQRKDLSSYHMDAAFWICLAGGVTLCGIGMLVAPLLAAFYREPALTRVVRVLSIGLAIGGVGVIPRALLIRQLDFRRLAILEIVAAFGYVLAAVPLAVLGFGAWSLVAGLLASTFLLSTTVWLATGWRPRFTFVGRAAVDLVRFGSNVMGATVLNYVYSNIDYLLIGYFLTTSALGLYTLAYQLSVVSLKKMSGLISVVAFPVFSRLQDNPDKVREWYLKAIRVTASIAFPISVGIALIAPQAVPLFLGQEWKPMIAPLQILCLTGAIKALGSHVGAVFLSRGRPDIELWWNALASIVLSSCVLVAVRFGISAVALASAATALCLFPMIQHVANRHIQLRPRSFFQALYPSTMALAALLASYVLARAVAVWLKLPEVASVALEVLASGVGYALALLCVDSRSVHDVYRIILGKDVQ